MKPASAFMPRFAAAMAAARRERHMTVRELASQIGISASALRRIENGESKGMRAETLFAVRAWAARRGIALDTGALETVAEKGNLERAGVFTPRGCAE